MDSKAISIHLELRVGDDESLTGRASCAGAARDFAGWLGLVATIDALVHEAPSTHLTTIPTSAKRKETHR